MLAKLLSGRFWLTIACALAFVWMVVNKAIEMAAALLIIREVFDSYFKRQDRNQGGKNE
jgi:hypothetical protein